jgi:hypothetical protein
VSDDLIDERVAALVARLADRTRAGRVRWELATADRDDSFTHAIPAGAVTIFSRDHDGRDPYVFTVRDADGRMVERVEVAKESQLYELVTDLYRRARHQALRTGAVIDALLTDLE